jgi:membrane dipeptidase
MIVIDSHLDLSWNALNWNRDLTLLIAEIRRAEAGTKEEHRGASTVCFPEMRKGEVALCLATLLARVSGLKEPLLDYASQDIAAAMARGQFAYYRIMEGKGYLRQVKAWPEVEAHLEAWRKGPRDSSAIGYILSLEGADPVLSPRHVVKWWEHGLRVVGLAHYGPSAYAHGTGPSGGLTRNGVELLKVMRELGMVLDVTHLSDESFGQALERYQGPVLASHNNCRALVPGYRQFTDDQIRQLIAREAVIGAALDSWMLFPNYVPRQTDNSQVKLEAVVQHLDHVCQLAGNARHAAIGSDLDGGFGREQSPSDLNTIADLQKIPALLRAKGYKESDVEGIMHGNWLRFFQRVWTKQ